jgi:hypothetical protein
MIASQNPFSEQASPCLLAFAAVRGTLISEVADSLNAGSLD